MNNFFNAILPRLQRILSLDEYRLWLKPLKWSYEASEQILLLDAPTIFHQKIIIKKYAPLILQEAAGCGILISKLTCRCLNKNGLAPTINLNCKINKTTTHIAAINPEHSFDSFAIFPSNRLAVMALEELCKAKSALAANAIFISSSGPWGKSHLLDALSLKFSGNKRVLRLGAEFLEEEEWKGADIIIADDIQHLENLPEIQKRLAHAFDEMISRNLCIIASGPLAPIKLQTLSEQLRSRLSGALTIKIDPPEFELISILAERKFKELGFELSSELISALAKAAENDPRRLSGFISSAVFISSNSNKSLTEAIYAVIMDKKADGKPLNPDINLIIETVAASFALKSADLKSAIKLRQVAWARRVAMYLAREMSDMTTSEIGKSFGGRDHSTVIYALKKIHEEIKNPTKAKITENIRRAIIMGEKEASLF